LFRIDDRRNAIKRIQTYLHFIRDRRYSELPPIFPDGIYGEETVSAVKAFQKMWGLRETGVVDLVTNNAIYSAFIDTVDTILLTKNNARDFPVYNGSSGIAVAEVNLLLRKLRKIYIDLPRSDTGDYFGYNTLSAVKYMQEIFGLDPSGVVDVALFNRLVREANLIEFLS
jgi:peptidoglycan hydrolase-like protein with peptidoglycan-binding domain